MAGHETTANSISFTLLELAKHPEVQMKIRQEIREMNAAKIASGDSDPSISDLDSMPYTIAVVKVNFDDFYTATALIDFLGIIPYASHCVPHHSKRRKGRRVTFIGTHYNEFGPRHQRGSCTERNKPDIIFRGI